MSIMLGNLTVKQIQQRLGIELTESEESKLLNRKQDEASDIAKDKWHCFDLPFVLVCGSYETAVFVHDILSPYSDKMNTQLQISING